MISLSLIFIILIAILIFYIKRNHKLYMKNQEIQKYVEELDNKIIKIECDVKIKNDSLNDIQIELFQFYSYSIELNQTMQAHIEVILNKIATLQSELYNARQRSKRLAKKANSTL